MRVGSPLICPEVPVGILVWYSKKYPKITAMDASLHTNYFFKRGIKGRQREKREKKRERERERERERKRKCARRYSIVTEMSNLKMND